MGLLVFFGFEGVGLKELRGLGFKVSKWVYLGRTGTVELGQSLTPPLASPQPRRVLPAPHFCIAGQGFWVEAEGRNYELIRFGACSA